jgi:origin recognition complex subunit 5
MNAILATLLEEHDLETRVIGAEFTQPGEYSEMELMRVHASGAVCTRLLFVTLVGFDALALICRCKVAELAAAHLLLRVSPSDRLDGPPMYKCGISFDVALALGRDMRVPLLDLIWETG